MSPARWPLLALAAFLAACTGEDTDPGDTDPGDTDTGDTASTAVVRVSGGAFLTVGGTLTLTASTVDGTDDGYAWTSSDTEAATVDATGLVSGHRPGDVVITATGNTTQASGTLTIAVRHEIPHQAEWAGSAHADLGSEAFQHFAEDDEVMAACAKCHTTTGYRDFLGDDGTAADAVDGPHPIGQVVACEACHNETTATLSHVLFPSGVVVEDLGAEAICMTCHQGLASQDTVDDAIATAKATGTEPPGDDVVDADLGFTNIHYYAAGATLEAGVVRGGYQYPDAIYDVRFRHVPGRDTCLGCHDPHTLILRLDACAGCHEGVASYDDVKDIRMIASLSSDYDGDGDLGEGLYYEVDGLRSRLYGALQTYATESATAASICYDGHTYPYWFVDTDGDGGPCEASEAAFPNRYTTWTPRLAKAAYNYQVASKDPGAFAHNGKYVIELLHDSIADLNAATTGDVDLTHFDRTDHGHFDGTSEAFRHWDEDEEVETACSKCHGGAEGFSFYVEHGVNIQHLETPNGLDCATCHPADWNYDAGDPRVVEVPAVTFPGGATIAGDDFFAPADAICATCHSGRESKATIDANLASTTAPRFRNVHYLPAAATFYGGEVTVGYEYSAHSYSGPWNHPPGTSCTYCHSPGGTDHTFKVEDSMALCSACHLSARTPDEIRLSSFDYDGDGDTTETLPEELASFQDGVLEALSDYATALGKPAICYDAGRYPYWFKDVTPFGPHCGAEDTAGYPNGSNTDATKGWDGPMVRAAHNYQMSTKDPGAWAHNMDYVTQILYDSIEDLEGDLGDLERPPAP